MKKITFAKIVCLAAAFCLAASIALNAQAFTELRAFNGTNGWSASSLVQGFDGNFYGTTQWGGTTFRESGPTDPGDGTVFEITPDGGLATLYNFCSLVNSQGECADGQRPNGLILAGNGNFYGTTFAGGSGGNSGFIAPEGTVFEITATGTLTTLYSFCTQISGPVCLDGAYPMAGLVQGVNGSFYGTTQSGGNGSTAGGGGTIFEITAAGKLTTLYNFCSQTNCTDGAEPLNGLVLAHDGNFYGTTTEGGANVNQFCPSGCGTIFKITPEGELTTLHNFCAKKGCTDGANPAGALIEGSDGAFYGTVQTGGNASSLGGFDYRITPAGKFSVLYEFCAESGCPDGVDPQGGVIQATDGNFYGVTNQGGAHTLGTAYELTPAGDLTTLYSFCSQSGCSDGEYITSGLMQATNGTFYGASSAGGKDSDCSNDGTPGCGTIYSIANGLGPFVESNPVFGKAGQNVHILGNNLTGASSVAFNGTAATTFTVVSATQIRVTVPTGATTGTIVVTTPTGTLNSNVAFQVLP